MSTKITVDNIANNSVGITQLNVSDGSNGQFLTTDGAGNLSFSTASGTTINNNADNRVITGSGTANTLEGESNFVFDSTNNRVGIGTSSPDYPLEVENTGVYHVNIKQTKTSTSDSSAYVTYYLQNLAGTSGTISGYLGSGGAGVTNTAMRNTVYMGSQSSHDVAIFTNDSERMRIDSSGNVGIGITNPSSYWSQADNLVIGGTGNEGITIKTGTSGNGRIAFTDTASSTAGLNDGGLISYAHQTDAMNFRTNGAERMRIDSDGNLILGTLAQGNSQGSYYTDGLAKISAADANENFIINGNFDIDQYEKRYPKLNTVYVGNGNKAYLDRWAAYGPGNFYISRNTGETLPNGKKVNYIRVQNQAGTVNSFMHPYQKVDARQEFIGQDMVVSCWARTNMSDQYIRICDTTQCLQLGPMFTPDGNWHYYEGTWTVPSSGVQTNSFFQIQPGFGSTTLSNSSYLDFACVKFEFGKKASAFEFEKPSEVLAQSQRYYYAMDTEVGYQRIGTGFVVSANQGSIEHRFPVEMRVAPSFAIATGSAANYAGYASATPMQLNSLTATDISTYNANLNCATATNVFTVGRGFMLIGNGANNGTSASIAFSAEW
tara:strand:+ start:2203 stop:4014 length:1812 start_codon:yes stop_codon:yes gene_type:complete